MAVVPVTAEPTFNKEFSNTWSVEDLDIYFLVSDRDSVPVPTDGAGLNPDYSEAIVNFNINYRGSTVNSDWVISISQESNVTTSLNDSLKRVTVTALSADTGSFTVAANKTGEAPIYRKISVFKAKDGVDGADGNGIVQDGTNLSLRPGDEGTAAGGTRGDGAVDLQTLRLDSTQIASGLRSGILSGSYNTASAASSVVAGGFNNKNNTPGGFIGSGQSNRLDTNQSNSSIVGGESNRIDGSTTYTSVIAGGNANEISASFCFIGAGDGNILSGTRGAIIAGTSNINSGQFALIGAGRSNNITHNYSSTIGSGADSTNIGETIISNSDSPVQKSIYLLEGYADAALTIASRSVWGSQGNIQMPDDTIMSGTIDFTLSGSTGDVKKRYAVLIKRASGSITVKKFTTVTDYTWNGDVTDADISLDVSSNTEIVFNVTGNTLSTSKCAVVFDTTLMDIYTV